MKIVYHGSSDDNVKVLKTSHSRDGLVYVTTSRNNALIYATRKYINLFKDKDGIIYFYNIYDNLFEKLYKSKIGYIYSSEVDESNLEEVNRGSKCNITSAYCSKQDITLINKEIVNVFDEFMKLKEEGKFIIINDESIIKIIREDYENHFRSYYENNELKLEAIEYFKENIPKLLDIE